MYTIFAEFEKDKKHLRKKEMRSLKRGVPLSIIHSGKRYWNKYMKRRVGIFESLTDAKIYAEHLQKSYSKGIPVFYLWYWDLFETKLGVKILPVRPSIIKNKIACFYIDKVSEEKDWVGQRPSVLSDILIDTDETFIPLYFYIEVLDAV
tara:strand:+ start:45 stop:491 length:447 start_codon:yes stop_codon:yes gene_type:complete